MRNLDLRHVDITIAGLHQHYRRGDFSPRELIDAVVAEAARDLHHSWIYRLSTKQITYYLDQLPDAPASDLPLYGIPFAIKDNIDLANVSTTAACPDFSYLPSESAFVVAQLLAAGAIPIGKTNMDQFATGLVGARSPEPWGPCLNSLNPAYISGGSSAGSAVAVARGVVSFSLGTDTAGSGRVPASLNNIVGLKPSRGLLSCRGVVPACRTLDCVSIFALTVADANAVFDVAARYDERDPFARQNTYGNGKRYFGKTNSKMKIGVPAPTHLEFFRNDEAASLYSQALTTLENSGAEFQEIDFSPFVQAARLLYEGPWLAERYIAIKAIIEESPGSLLPEIQSIIGRGNDASAVDAFEAIYQLQTLTRLAEAELKKVDAVLTPTAGTVYTVDEVIADPIALNSRLGYYTNFMNLLDCAALALPTGFYQSGVGFGITLFHRALADKRLLSIAALLERETQLPLGATGSTHSAAADSATPPCDYVDVVVCGAHLDGLPLNWQLQERGAQLLQLTTTASNYRFYALAGGPPLRPGLIRDEQQGRDIEVEVWRMPMANFGSFVAEVPAPLGIGKVELADGSWCSGFICDAWGLADATDITEHGAWRQYLRSGS